MNLRFSTKLVLVLIFFVILVLGVVGSLSFWYGSDSLSEAAISQMQATALEKDAELETWLDERGADVVEIAKDELILRSTGALTGSAPGSQKEQNSRFYLQSVLANRVSGADSTFLELFIIDPQSGVVAASTSPSDVGRQMARDPLFESGKKGLFVPTPYYSAELGAPALTVASPMRTADRSLIGVLGVQLNLARLDGVVKRHVGDHQSTDAFLVNADAMPITQPRFLQPSNIPGYRIETEVVRQLVTGKSGVITAKDYRGVRSLAAFRWNPKYKFGLVVKIDQTEALAPVQDFGTAVFLFSLGTLFAAGFLSYFLARSITRPIRTLQDKVKEFSKGDEVEPSSKKNGSEVEALAREFEQMAKRIDEHTEKLAAANAELEAEILDRTATAENVRLEQERYLRQRNALISIAEHETKDLPKTLEYLTYVAAVTLGVARVSVWRFDPGHTAIECEDLYELEKNKHQSGMNLAAADYPKYFDAMSLLKYIAADDAQNHPNTAEFTEGYLAPLGITSMLDVPIRVGGVLYGVLCHEHIGQARHWTTDEQTFAVAVANSVSLAVERAERQRTEQILRESEARVRAITDAAQDAVLMMDPEGLIAYWNPAAERIFGYTSDEAMGRDLHDLIVPARYHAAHRKAIPAFKKTGCGNAIGRTIELEAINKTGREIAVDISLSSVRLGDKWYAIGMIRDVTESKKSVEELKVAHAQIEQMLAHSPAMIYAHRIDGETIVPVSVSANFTEILGYQVTEVLSYEWWLDALHPDDRERAVAGVAEMFSAGFSNSEYRVRHKNGEYRWIEDNRRVLSDGANKNSRIVGVWIDVTERHESEAAMREIESNYQDLFENASDLIQAITPDGRIAFVNPAWLNALGYSEDEVAALSLQDIVDEQYLEHCLKEMERAMSGQKVTAAEAVFVSKDKRKIYVEGNVTCKFAVGKPVHTLGIFRDVTERKLAEMDLLERNERMLLQTAALESAANGVAITDTRGTIEWINPAFTKLTGYSADEVIGQNPRVLKSGKNPESFYLDLWGTISKGEVWHGDLINRRKDGRYYYEEMTITPVRDTNGKVGHYIAIKQDVTANRAAEEELRKSEATLAKAQQIAHLGNWEWDIKADELYWSDEIFRMLGIESTGARATRASFFDRVHPDDREKIEDQAKTMLQTKHWESLEYRILRPDGTQRTIFSDGSVTLDENGAPEKLTGIMMDISELRETEESFRSVVETANDGIIMLNQKGEILSWNMAAQTIFGYTEDEIRGKQLMHLFPDSYREQIAAAADCDPLDISGLLLPGCRGTAMTGKKGDGAEFPLEITVSSWQSGDGTLYSAIVRDITQRKSLEDRLTYQTLHDPLTDLANRVLFGDRLGQAIKKCRRNKGTVGVLFIDLDNFKNVNDTLGHAAGDELLIGVAERIKGCLRDGDTAARLGGDEFAVLVDDSNGLAGAILVAERIHDEILAPFYLNGNEAYVGTSIGVTVTSTGKETPDEILRNADVAMYTAKTSGKNQYVVFQSEMHDEIVRRVQLESDMRAALENNEFQVHYQPIVDLATERILGMEALARWNHPKRGLIGPSEFISVAEDTQIILDLGKWILEAACAQTRAWQLCVEGAENMSVTVNLSSRQFRDDDLVLMIQDVLARTDLPPDSLIIEITETALLKNTEKTLDTLRELKLLGVRLAIDDFGTGYSSLSYLQQFPIDVLKIDRLFIDTITQPDEGSAVARAIITISESLHMTTIAEGVETFEQQSELLKLGCRVGQGFHFSRPLTTDAMEDFLKSHAMGRFIEPRRRSRRRCSAEAIQQS